MKETFKLLSVMAAISVAAGILLALTSRITAGPIEAARQREFTDALKKVLPSGDTTGEPVRIPVVEAGKTNNFYVVYDDAGKFAGAAFATVSPNGYGGAISLMVGIGGDRTICGLEVLDAANETPGLGSKIKEPGFRDQFKGRSAVDTGWAAVSKEGGAIDSITGATISSKAVIEAVLGGLELFKGHLDGLAGDKPGLQATGGEEASGGDGEGVGP